MGKMNTKQVLEVINNHQYEQLSDYLSDVNWLEIDPLTIVPQQAIRNFAKAIVDKEVRLDVMRFLEAYAENYFRAGAEELVRHDYAQKHVGFTSGVIRIEADQYLDKFKTELKTQINQLQFAGEFSGDKFQKQEKRIKQLEKEVEELSNANKFLQEKIDRFEHPEKYGKFIPYDLNNSQFRAIMEYLQSKQIVSPLYSDSVYGKTICCYHWYASKALFGYYVERLNEEFELNEAREQRNWQIFESVFENYDEIVEEARKAVSKYRNDPKVLLPTGADHVKNAIEEANKNEASSR